MILTKYEYFFNKYNVGDDQRFRAQGIKYPTGKCTIPKLGYSLL